MKRTLLILLSLVMIFSFAACGNDDDGNNKADRTSEQEEPKQDEADNKDDVLGVGESGTMEDIDLTLNSVEESQGDDYFAPDEGYVFVIAEFTVVNNKDEDVIISSLMSFQPYVDDEKTNVNINATASAENSLDGTLAPGKKMTGVIGVQAPADWKTLEIQYIGLNFSENKLVFRYEK